MYHIKVVDIAPKITFLGANIDEAVHLQREHDIVFKQLQVSIFYILRNYRSHNYLLILPQRHRSVAILADR